MTRHCPSRTGSFVQCEEVEVVSRLLGEPFVRGPGGGLPVSEPMHERAFRVHGASTAAPHRVAVEEPGSTNRAAELTAVRQLVESRSDGASACVPTADTRQQSVARLHHLVR